MKKRNLGILALLMFVLFAGIYIGYYVTAVRYEYIRGYGGANEAMITLDLLDRDLTGKVAEFKQGNLIAGFAVVDNLPNWARAFNPSNEDRPKPEERMESHHQMIVALEGHFAMEVYGLTPNDLKRILNEHFGHYVVLRASQEAVDEMNERLRESDDITEEASEPGEDGNG